MKKFYLVILIACVAINGIVFGYEWCDYITEWYEVIEVIGLIGGIELLGALMWSSIKYLCKGEKESK